MKRHLFEEIAFLEAQFMARNFSTSNYHHFAAERGEDALTFYDARMAGATWHEKHEYAALRHSPDNLRHAMSSMLTDLQCLAAAQGLGWDEMLQAANHTYVLESQEDGHHASLFKK